MKSTPPLVFFLLQLLAVTLCWLFVAAWQLALGGPVCPNSSWDIFLVLWCAGFIFGLIAPGLAFRLGAPALGMILLALSLANFLAWAEYGDLAAAFYCPG